MLGLMSTVSPKFDRQIPEGDDRLRRVCRHCGFVDYVNPKIVAGAVCVEDERILLCQRSIAPRKGYWTLPAGFMEEGESVEDAARREAREEACADITLEGLIGVYSVPAISQVHVMFRASLNSEAQAGDETDAVMMVDWAEIPWGEIAFPTVKWALEDWRAAHDTPTARLVPHVRSNPPPVSG